MKIQQTKAELKNNQKKEKVRNNNKSNYINKILMTFIILVFTTLTLNFVNHTPIIMWDEPVYLNNAMSHLEPTYFTEDFRFPLLEYIIALTWLITGISVKSAQVLMILFSIGTIILFYLISKFLIKASYLQICATTLFSFSYLFLYWSYRIYSDIGSLFFLFASIYTFFLCCSNSENIIQSKNYLCQYKSDILIILSGIATSLAFLMRYSSAISALLIAPYLLYKKKFRYFICYAIGNGFVLFPWLLYNLIKYKSPLWDLLAQKGVIDAYTSWQPINIFFGNLILSSFVLIFFLILFLVLYVKDKKLKQNFAINFTLIILILSILYYSFGVNLKLLRYHLMILPFITLLSFVAINELIKIIETSNINKAFKIVIYCTLGLLFIIQLIINVNQVTTKIYQEYDQKYNSSTYQSIEFIQNEVSEGEVVISNGWTWYGFYGNHKARSIWDKNIDNVLFDTDNGYLVLNDIYPINFENITYTGELIKNITDNRGQNVQIYYVYK